MPKNKKEAIIKDMAWFYEKEYRIVFDEKDEKNLDIKLDKNGNKTYFLKVKITNIYLGVNFDKNLKDDREEIYSLCREKT